MSKVIFDVGANNGMEFLEQARRGDTIYAFEPTPELANHIRDMIEREHFSTYHFIEKAVSDVAGKAKFNVTKWGDWGCSSLNEFSYDLSETWPEMSASTVTEVIEVDVIRMDDFIAENKIERIDFLHIDTQGSDLAVLKSFGDKLSIVLDGRMEVSSRASLYSGTPTKQECVEFLESNGFEIYKEVPNDKFAREENLYFRRPW